MALVEPTPTLEEFVYTWTPGGIVPTDLEGLLYFEIKLAILVAPTAVHTAWLMAAHGMEYRAAAYIATDTKAWWWAFKKLETYGKFLRSPVAVVGGTALVAHHHTMTSPPPTVALQSEPGQASWWRAVSQSIGAGGFGVGTGIRL